MHMGNFHLEHIKIIFGGIQCTFSQKLRGNTKIELNKIQAN